MLFEDAASSVGGTPGEVRLRIIGNCLKADRAYGKDVADALGVTLSEEPA